MGTTTHSRETTRLIYEASQFPVFQHRMYSSAEAAMNCPKGDMRLVQSLDSGLVFNEAFRPELVVYDEHYQCEQAVSSTFRAHLDAVAGIIDQNMSQQPIVEIGCGKGYFLELLTARGLDVTGYDPAYEGSNPRVIKRYFSPAAGHAGHGLILRHVLEHVQDPFSFLSMLRDTNGGSGKIYIEVPCFDWICEHRAWFDIFYEHVNYFRLSDFHRMFGEIYRSGKAFGDQYLFVVAELSSLRAPTYDEGDSVELPVDFLQAVHNRFSDNEPVIVWGGASKGLIFSLLKERTGQKVGAVIDINPGKQGKYLPATGLRVSSPEEVIPSLPRGSKIYVMNSNYMDEIKQMTDNIYEYIGVDNA